MQLRVSMNTSHLVSVMNSIYHFNDLEFSFYFRAEYYTVTATPTTTEEQENDIFQI